MPPGFASTAIWTIWGAATAGVIMRPFKLPEAVWAVAGALLIVGCGLLPLDAAWAAVRTGGDVYLFLIGMMLLSETARTAGVFDWVAIRTVNAARGSTRRLFALVFAVGTVVTIFLSNDATAVVLTPAVYAAAQKAGAKPLPLLFACAMIANAASFVLPISNPANLVLYGGTMPPLGAWLESFGVPSLLAIAATFGILAWVERGSLGAPCRCDLAQPDLSRGGMIAVAGITGTAALLVTVSAFDAPLGLPTCLAGIATMLLVCIGGRRTPVPILSSISWSVLPLVAGLFVLVAALAQTGVVAAIAQMLHDAAQTAPRSTAASAATILAIGSNLINNLPAGLIASTTIYQAHPPQVVTDALLIGVDLGPNLSITGSLATILWLTAIRREGMDVGFWQFLRVGARVMPPALALALAARIAIG